MQPLTSEQRLALVALVGLMAAVALARREPTTIVQPPQEQAVQVATAQGDALRDERRLDPNLASVAELVLLPGVGPSLAKRIVEARERHGRFRSSADLRRVKGVGEKTLQKFVHFLRFDSEGVEHTAQSDLAFKGGSDLGAGLHDHPGPQIEPDGQSARP